MNRMSSAYRWCMLFINAALETGRTPREILDRHELKFQKFFPYDPKIDKIFRMTNIHEHGRQGAQKNYEKLFEKGILKRSEVLG